MEKTTDAPVHASHMSGFKMPKNTPDDPGIPELSALEDTPVVTKKTSTFEEMAKDKTPQEIKELAGTMSYADRINAFDLSMDEAMDIVDSLVTKGEYRESVKMSKTMSAVIGTRNTRYNSYLSKVVDSENPRKTGRLNQIMTEYQLAGSLLTFGDSILPEIESIKDEEEWIKAIEVRVDFVKQLQGPIFLTLCNKLAKFDSKMMIVFSDGYDENF